MEGRIRKAEERCRYVDFWMALLIEFEVGIEGQKWSFLILGSLSIVVWFLDVA